MITQEIYDKIDEIIIDALAGSFVKHGHFMTGKIIDDIEIKRSEARDGVDIDYYMYPYGAYLERGVKADRIPFSPGSGAKHSMYIEGLISYVKMKYSVSDVKKATSIAFSIAHTHLRHGMPFRTGGKGTKWILDAISEAEQKMDSLGEQHYQMINAEIENMILKFERE